MPRAAVLLLSLALLAGCGDPAEGPELPPDPGKQDETTPTRTTDPVADRHPPAPRCPSDAGNCATAAGRIVYLESVDPDGDGDLHLVLSGGSVTGPGLSVIDVAPRLRPKADPKVGDWAAAAGPVYRGSYGQRQIQATRLVVDPRRSR